MKKTQETKWGSLTDLSVKFPIIDELLERFTKEDVINLIEKSKGPDKLSVDISFEYFEKDV